MTKLINQAQDSPAIKVILIHGGKEPDNFQSAVLVEEDTSTWNLNDTQFMNNYIKAIKTSKKPIVAVFRGEAAEFGFAILDYVDFSFVSPDAYFNTPFK